MIVAPRIIDDIDLAGVFPIRVNVSLLEFKRLTAGMVMDAWRRSFGNVCRPNAVQ